MNAAAEEPLFRRSIHRPSRSGVAAASLLPPPPLSHPSCRHACCRFPRESSSLVSDTTSPHVLTRPGDGTGEAHPDWTMKTGGAEGNRKQKWRERERRGTERGGGGSSSNNGVRFPKRDGASWRLLIDLRSEPRFYRPSLLLAPRYASTHPAMQACESCSSS